MKPALTAKEWERVLMGAPPAPLRNIRRAVHERGGNWEYAQAALYLHDQPFGFGRWMVDWLMNRGAGSVPLELRKGQSPAQDIDAYIGARIEALLPPEEEE
jgi:hypothetical protein